MTQEMVGLRPSWLVAGEKPVISSPEARLHRLVVDINRSGVKDELGGHVMFLCVCNNTPGVCGVSSQQVTTSSPAR